MKRANEQSADAKGLRLPEIRPPTDPGSGHGDVGGFDFNAALAEKIDGCLQLARALSAGVDHVLDEFVSLQEILVLLVPDEDFNEVFRGARLTDLRMLLSAVAGRIEVVTDSPGLQMTSQEVRDLRERIAAGANFYAPGRGSPVETDRSDRDAGDVREDTGDDDGGVDLRTPPGSRAAPDDGRIVTLREGIARARESAENGCPPGPGATGRPPSEAPDTCR